MAIENRKETETSTEINEVINNYTSSRDTILRHLWLLLLNAVGITTGSFYYCCATVPRAFKCTQVLGAVATVLYVRILVYMYT